MSGDFITVKIWYKMVGKLQTARGAFHAPGVKCFRFARDTISISSIRLKVEEETKLRGRLHIPNFYSDEEWIRFQLVWNCDGDDVPIKSEEDLSVALDVMSKLNAMCMLDAHVQGEHARHARFGEVGSWYHRDHPGIFAGRIGEDANDYMRMMLDGTPLI